MARLLSRRPYVVRTPQRFYQRITTPNYGHRNPGRSYDQVYRATYDAVWAVVGEVIYGLFLMALFLVGLDIVVVSLTGFAATATPIAVVFALLGVVLVIVTAHRFAKLFDLLPWS
jgi:hypothetical protein